MVFPPANNTRHRRCIPLFGTPAETAAFASALVRELRPEDVLWVSELVETEGPGSRALPPAGARRLLGRSFDAVVLDLHLDVDANLLGQCAGFVWGGGALVLRLPPPGSPPAQAQERGRIEGFGTDQVGLRFWARLLAHLPPPQPAKMQAAGELPAPLSGAVHAQQGTGDQFALVDALVDQFCQSGPALASVTADRGRGKSAALGLALGRIASNRRCRIAVTAGEVHAVREVLRFAGPDAGLHFTSLNDLLHTPQTYDLIAVDEAAQLPVPALQRLVRQHPSAQFVFATTTRGYEGTGRGYTLRFLAWLHQQQGPVREYALSEPIRWAAGDPLEAALSRILLWDAELPPATQVEGGETAVEPVLLHRDELAHNEPLLSAFFGLLVHAHYRTTPDDLRQLLDGPNVRLHALLSEGKVLGASLVALEGGLPRDISESLTRGERRLRGHALPETLCSHAGHPEAGEMQVVRSVRIAVHPGARRQGLASTLVQSLEACYQPDFFGTLFGATAGLVRFRRQVGYEVVRVGASRGARTGEPSVAMMKPITHRAQILFGHLRRALARDLLLQLRLMEAGHELDLDPCLRTALLDGLPPHTPLTPEEQTEALNAYAFGPRTQEAAAMALQVFVNAHLPHLQTLPTAERVCLQSRILEEQSWEQTRIRAGMPTIAAAMRAARRAVRALLGA